MKLFVWAALCCAFPLSIFCADVGGSYGIGATLLGPKPGCPVFIGGVSKGSPAQLAGIKAGDRLLSVDGKPITGLNDASQQMRASEPRSVMLRLGRDDSTLTVSVRRVEFAILFKQSGQKVLDDGTVVSAHLPDAEVKRIQQLTSALEKGDVAVDVAFRSHYPSDKSIFYPGFEAFIWPDGHRVTVGGIEQGPAARAGVRWGDEIILANGTSPAGKSVKEVESLLSSSTAANMTLVVARGNDQTTFSFELERAADVLRENNWQMVDGKIVPLWVSGKYLDCFR